jgi:alpha-tubulin suppressor-like RCC1 family protein
VTVPGTVAEVGTSNSTEYALLTNGSLYAWGLGTQGQLGDGRSANSFTRPVRVRFPGRDPDRIHPGRRHAVRHRPGRGHEGKRLGLG